MSDSRAEVLARSLIGIDSSNPSLMASGAGERAIAAFASDRLAERGFECRHVWPDDRPSVIAVHRGTGGGSSIMLNGHLATVSLDSYEGAPLEPRVVDYRASVAVTASRRRWCSSASSSRGRLARSRWLPTGGHGSLER